MPDRSLWIATSGKTSHAPLDGAVTADVAVVGGGLAGLLTAALLSLDGARVALVEGRRLALGATGNTTAKVTALHGAIYRELTDRLGDEHARRYAEANLAGVELIANLASRFDLDCDLRRAASDTWTADTGRIVELEDEVSAARRIGVPLEFVELDLPYGAVAAARLEDQVLFHPRRFCLGLARALADRVRIYEDTRVHAVDEHGDRVDLTCDRGSVTADHAVIATLIPFGTDGGWFARLHASRSYAIAVALDGPGPERMGIGVDEPVRSVRPAAHDGTPLAIVEGGEHHTGQGGDANAYIADLERWAREHLPVQSVTHAWSAQDFMSPDRIPFVGPTGGEDSRVHVATGFSKWGMSNGAAAALMLSDRIAGRDNAWAGAFDPSRLGGASGLKQLAREGLATARRYASDLVGASADGTPTDIPVGQGAVIDHDGEQVAVHRDRDGHLRAVSAKCTHLGCTVTWNDLEATWDCPCHGSRFAVDGAVIEGPATEPLEGRTVSEPADR